VNTARQPLPSPDDYRVGTMFLDDELARRAARLRADGMGYDEIVDLLGFPTSVEAKRAVWRLAVEREGGDAHNAVALIECGRNDLHFWREVRAEWEGAPWRPDWVWREIFDHEGSRLLMTAAEQEHLDSLPPVLTLLRGTIRQDRLPHLDRGFSWQPYTDDDGPELGFSWTMRRETAELFGAGEAKEGLISRDDVIAFFTFNQELIVRPEHVVVP